MKAGRWLLWFALALLWIACSSAAGSDDPILKTFRQPPKEYGPVPIWWWSGEEIKKERLAWQLEHMAAGHVYNAIILNLYPAGDRPSYFSPKWWELMDFTLEQAEKLGIGIWFYDGLGFARSDVHRQLMAANPSFRAETLERAEADVSGGESVELSLAPGARFVAAAASPVRDDSTLGQGVDLSDRVKGGMLRWTAPDGRWRAMVFYARPADYDFSNPRAAAKLIDAVHGEYERRYRRYLGNVIPGSFQDELPAMPRWSSGLFGEFRKRKGYDLIPHLPALFHDCGPGTAKFRFDYRDVIAGMLEDAFFKPCFEWHRKFGMICGMDQMIRNADPVRAQSYYIDYFRTMRWFDAPGQDQHGDAKAHSSIAHLYGRPRVWQEGFYNSGWGQTLEELAGLVNAWYVRGANLYDPHAWYYSTAGSWWEWAPPCTSFRQPYWRHYKYFADYVARMSYILSQGSHVCDIAVLYPSTTIQGEMAIDGRVSEAAQASRDCFWAAVRALDQDRRDYDWMDEASLQRAVCRKGKLEVSGETYGVLILPNVSLIRTASVEKLKEFCASGGRLVIIGNAPSGSPEKGRADAGVRQAFNFLCESPSVRVIPDAGALPRVLEPLARDFSPEIGCMHRRIRGREFYFIVPDDLSPRTVRFGARGRPEIWDPYTGAACEVADYSISDAGTEVLLDFDESPAYFVVIDPTDTSPRAVRDGGDALSEVLQIPLSDEWGFRLEPTMDDRWGDFRLPASDGFIPIEVREFRFAEEAGTNGLAAGWHGAGFDDAEWGRVLYTYAPYWMTAGPFQTSGPEEFGKPLDPEIGAGDWRPVVYSRQFGIEKDPIHRRTLGPKLRVPPEFVDFGSAPPWSVRYLSTYAYSPDARGATLEVGCPFAKRVWLNDEIVLDQPGGAPIENSAAVTLKRGWNRILIKLAQSGSGNMRVSFALSEPGEGHLPEAQWLWDGDAGREIVYFRKVLDLADGPRDAHVYITCDNGYELYVNGKLIGDELGYDTIFWQEAERYSLPLHKGRNVIAVKGTNLGGPAGLLIWGMIEMPSGKKLSIRTDESWLISTREIPDWQGMDAGGEWIHPTAFGTADSSHWGVIRRGPEPGERADGPRMPIRDMPGILYDPEPARTTAAWYRFRLPPGTEVIRPSAGVPCEVYVNGKRQVLERDGTVRLGSPALSGGVCAIRAAQKPGFRAGAVFKQPIQFECGPGKITLGSWHEKGLPHYSGIGIYSRTFELPAEYAGRSVTLDLGAVRGTAEVLVNGRPAGVRIWTPYRFDISDLVRAGRNELEITVTNTLGPHYKVGPPTPYVYAGQEVSGILGPVAITVAGAGR